MHWHTFKSANTFWSSCIWSFMNLIWIYSICSSRYVKYPPVLYSISCPAFRTEGFPSANSYLSCSLSSNLTNYTASCTVGMLSADMSLSWTDTLILKYTLWLRESGNHSNWSSSRYLLGGTRWSVHHCLRWHRCSPSCQEESVYWEARQTESLKAGLSPKLWILPKRRNKSLRNLLNRCLWCDSCNLSETLHGVLFGECVIYITLKGWKWMDFIFLRRVWKINAPSVFTADCVECFLGSLAAFRVETGVMLNEYCPVHTVNCQLYLWNRKHHNDKHFKQQHAALP